MRHPAERICNSRYCPAHKFSMSKENVTQLGRMAGYWPLSKLDWKSPFTGRLIFEKDLLSSFLFVVTQLSSSSSSSSSVTFKPLLCFFFQENKVLDIPIKYYTTQCNRGSGMFNGNSSLAATLELVEVVATFAWVAGWKSKSTMKMNNSTRKSGFEVEADQKT